LDIRKAIRNDDHSSLQRIIDEERIDPNVPLPVSVSCNDSQCHTSYYKCYYDNVHLLVSCVWVDWTSSTCNAYNYIGQCDHVYTMKPFTIM